MSDYPIVASCDDPSLPRYVRTAAKRDKRAIEYVVCGYGCYQLMTASDLAEYRRNLAYLADEVER